MLFRAELFLFEKVKANKWCSNGVDLLAGQPIDKFQTPQGAQSALVEIERFLRTSKELKLNNPKEFRQLFDSLMTAETRATVQQVLKRMEDVQGMCEKRRDSLRHIIDPRPRPVQQVNPEPASVPQPAPGYSQRESQLLKPSLDEVDSSILGHQRKISDGKRPAVSLEKSVRYRPEVQQGHPAVRGLSDVSSTGGVMVSRSASDVSSSMSTAETQRSSLSSVSMSSFPESEGLQAKRSHVMNELIETEEAYVNELNQILQGYYNKMEDRSLQMMIPPALLGQRNVLFGNLQQIHNFHKDIFLHELKACQDCPSRVGKCFVDRKEEFQMYSIYCQNKPKSEAMRVAVGDNNPFFKECQRQLGHRLPLGAYLLKPIQRITKYQLLLKEMLRTTGGDNPDLTFALKEALDTMLSVLAYLNDSMHQVAIVGYGDNIADLGRLLMHGSFRVWTEHKHDKFRDLRLRPMQRHVFLYQRSLLLCKKKDEHHGNGDQPTYTFKNKLNLSQVGLTEKIKGDKRKFELWLRGREEVYIIQAPDLQTKEVWVKEIKRVLMTQFDYLKANKKIETQHLFSTVTPVSQLSSDSSDYSLDNWKSSESDRQTAVHQGLELSSPLLTPPSPAYNDRQDEDDDYDDDYDRGWSSGEFSNTDDETTESYIPKIEPSYKEHFVSLGDYSVIDQTELGLLEGDEVEIMRVGTNGWWYARHLRNNQEGWVPSTYLEPVSRSNTLYSSSDSLCVAGAKSEMTRSRSSSPYYRTNSPVPETTV
ncbi:guanine nucleotide exchange factor DBS [Bulinus truncatus]|nr:guanine nucleotide exchange factor DBS [Bulinus truncatus]